MMPTIGHTATYHKALALELLIHPAIWMTRAFSP